MPPGEPGRPSGFPAAGPSIRIGLAAGLREINISAASRFYLQEKIPEAAQQIVLGPVEIRVESGAGRQTRVYRAQTASLSRKEAAEELRRKLATEFDAPAFVRQASADRFQVRIGEFESRQEAQRFVAGPLRNAGYTDAFVVEETGAAERGEPSLALRGPHSLFRLNRAGYLFFPANDGDFLRLDGKAYRGALDIALGRNGSMTVVNQLGVEEYLLGVVAAEMSPSTYPAPAALAAQAIAARTYALKNVGRYRSEGYDLTNDARTQVYGGVASERELASLAVRNTFGLAVYYQGQLIDAMYTSTCGGRTEDFAAVFDASPVPYLVSVLCAVESEAAESSAASLRGSHALDRLVVSSDGRIANREIELAQLFGMVAGGSLALEYLDQPAKESEIRDWVESTRRAARRNQAPVQEEGQEITSHAGFIRYAAEAIFGAQELSRSISKADAAYYLANLKDGGVVPDSVRVALAFLIQKGLWLAYPDNRARPEEPILRKDALPLLVRSLLFIRPDLLSSAVMVNLVIPLPGSEAGPTLSLKWGSKSQTIPVAREVRLFQRGGERSTPTDSLLLIGSEKLSFRVNKEGQIDFLEAGLNPAGAASDRFSPVATWRTDLSRSQVFEKLRPLAPGVGELRDLEPARLGNSGRVVQLRVIGSRGSAVLNGYRVRNVLGLRDTLYTIKRARGPDGEIESFTFDGRGYGHGVGLCQVGAFGMARAGRSYEDILKTYYSGVEISRAY
jgi:stage II sporulation protein D